MAQLSRRQFIPAALPLTALAFVTSAKGGNYWNVPQTSDYGAACNRGRQYACELMQYLKDNPQWVASNILGSLVSDMAAHKQGTGMDGYAVGFWSALERLLYRAATRENHWDVMQEVQDRYDAINTARDNDIERNNL